MNIYQLYVTFIIDVKEDDIFKSWEVFMEESNQRIACMRCKHYHSTFDPTAQRGCKLFHFKSNLMPFILVKQATGSDCTSFEERKVHKEDEAVKDFNDQKYW